MVGAGVPPTVTVPEPENVIVRPVLSEPLEVPLKLGKFPVSPAYAPVPPVTVPEPVSAPPLSSADAGSDRVPVSVPPPEKVTV